MDETERIRRAYAKRDQDGKGRLFSFFLPGHLFIHQQRERSILQALEKTGLSDLSNLSVLEVGCGTGDNLRKLVEWGARPENLFGMDLLEDRIETARALSPNMNFQQGNAEDLSYPDGRFDLILCFTVFTSILDSGMRGRVAQEMLRVLKPQGRILWYDYFIDNPRNPDVRSVTRRELSQLFPNCRLEMKRVTLAPPLARRLAPLSWVSCLLLEKIPLLRTHLLGVISKPC